MSCMLSQRSFSCYFFRKGLALLCLSAMSIGLCSCDGDDGGSGGAAPPGALKGYWVWEKRIQDQDPQSGDVDKGQMKLAF